MTNSIKKVSGPKLPRTIEDLKPGTMFRVATFNNWRMKTTEPRTPSMELDTGQLIAEAANIVVIEIADELQIKSWG
jgi:hypothetical protein